MRAEKDDELSGNGRYGVRKWTNGKPRDTERNNELIVLEAIEYYGMGIALLIELDPVEYPVPEHAIASDNHSPAIGSALPPVQITNRLKDDERQTCLYESL